MNKNMNIGNSRNTNLITKQSFINLPNFLLCNIALKIIKKSIIISTDGFSLRKQKNICHPFVGGLDRSDRHVRYLCQAPGPQHRHIEYQLLSHVSGRQCHDVDRLRFFDDLRQKPFLVCTFLHFLHKCCRRPALHPSGTLLAQGLQGSLG